METLNKNWFAFTLMAIIFGILGYLLGRQAKQHSCPMMKDHHPMMFMEGGMGKGQKHMMFIPEGADIIEDIDIQKIEGEDGEKRIEVKVKAKKEK
jgi:hypothetical protein